VAPTETARPAPLAAVSTKVAAATTLAVGASSLIRTIRNADMFKERERKRREKREKRKRKREEEVDDGVAYCAFSCWSR
jgi:hypothetical protein